ncbi:hypothetical protein MnTg02_03309 [bacterium MnTg02]|nr:hypothetical protein MnTg02_03309 [bacterium MnTg02]
MLFIIFSLYSLTSALGLYSLSRANSVGTAQSGKLTYTLAKENRDTIKSRLDKLGQTRTVGEVEGDIAAGKANKRYATTKGCTPAEITATKSRTFCDQYARLNGELATAKEADDLRNKLLAATAKIGGMDLSKVLRSADPQSEALAKLSGFSPENIRSALAALVAILIELGSGLGLWVATGGAVSVKKPKETKQSAKPQPGAEVLNEIRETLNQPKRRLKSRSTPSPSRPTDTPGLGRQLQTCPIEQFAASNMKRKRRAEVTAKELYQAFRNWAEAAGIEPPKQTAFGRTMSELGYRKERRGGAVRYLGVELALAKPHLAVVNG